MSDQFVGLQTSKLGGGIAVAVGMWLTAYPGPVTGRQVRTLDPVWTVEIDGSKAVVVTNKFGAQDRAAFPIASLRVNRFIENTSEAHRQRTRSKHEAFVAPLYIDALGRVAHPELVLMPPKLVSMTASSIGHAILDHPAHKAQTQVLRGIPGRVVSYPDISGEELWAWTKSKNDELGIIHLENKTIFFSPTTGSVMSRYDGSIYDVVFAANKRLLAAATAYMRSYSRIVIFDFEGQLVYESDWSNLDHRQLYLTPTGEGLVFERALDAETIDTAYLDLATGKIATVRNVPKGFRYHSRDGKYMLMIHAGVGAHYFDTTRPLVSRELWVYDTGRMIVSASVSDDGQLIALQTQDRTDNPSKDVIIVDKGMNLLARAPGAWIGVEFVGNYLLVGKQLASPPSLCGLLRKQPNRFV